MAFNEDTSFIEYNVEQPTQDFVTNFDTIGGNTDVGLVTEDGVLTDTPESSYTGQQINHTTWRVTPEVQAGSVVRLYRVTNIDEMMHVFTAGAKFIERNMDNNFKQIRHAQQEVRDGFSKLSTDTYEIIDTLEDVAQSAQDAADAANDAAQVANDAATQVSDKVDRSEGAALPYNPALTYLEGAVVVKDGELQQWKGGEWIDVSSQEVKKYLLAAGVDESELDDDYNYLMQRLAQIAVDKGWDASFVVYNGGNLKENLDNQHLINEQQSMKNSLNVDILDFVPKSEWPAIFSKTSNYDCGPALAQAIATGKQAVINSRGLYKIKTAYSGTTDFDLKMSEGVVLDLSECSGS